MKNTIVIAAICSRSYVQVAVDAGFDVIAIDAFADVDTQNLANKVIQVEVNHGQFDAQQLLDALSQINLDQCIGLSYGAGFEAQPALLNQIALLLPVIGNGAEVLTQCKKPQSFFALCDACNMPYPKTVFKRPVNTLGWLEKTIGASGGQHIKSALPLELKTANQVYYQQKQMGMPISCLFLADCKNAHVLGFNEQWCSPTELSPYRFGGLVSHTELSETVQSKLMEFVQLMTQKLGLKGLNSCDCLVQNDNVLMLEINPRLSASVGLYQTKRGNLFAAHVTACLGQLNRWPVVKKQACALQVVYAEETAKVPAEMNWPDWVCDIPPPKSVIPAGAPICSVIAKARTAELAKYKVLERAASL